MIKTNEPSWSYETRVVAFVDVLGFKALTALPDAECERIVSLISDLLSAPRHDPMVNRFYSPTGQLFSARLFSDCICMSDALSPQGCRNVVTQAASVARSLACEGIYVRGGIAIGRHFQDINIIFGEGIVRAYELEKDRARFPRIVIDKAVVDQLTADAAQLASEDTDGELFVDFWKYWEWDHTTLDIDVLEMTEAQRYAHQLAAFMQAKRHLQQSVEVAETGADSRIREKLQWLADYHNARAQDLLQDSDAERSLVRSAPFR